MTITDAMIEAVFLVALAEAKIPPDVGELLVRGNPALGVAPGALRKALVAAERAAWRPIEEADPGRAYLLYYPEKVTGAHRQAKLPARVVVGYPGDSPNRLPTHFRPFPRQESQMSKPAEPIKEEFCQRFVAHMLAQAGETFDDGRSVKEYAEENALAYWDDPHYRDEGPEACAESDMSYWGED